MSDTGEVHRLDTMIASQTQGARTAVVGHNKGYFSVSQGATLDFHEDRVEVAAPSRGKCCDSDFHQGIVRDKAYHCQERRIFGKSNPDRIADRGLVKA